MRVRALVGPVALALLAACGSGEQTSGQETADPGPESGGALSAWDSSVCARIDTGPYADILGVEVPRLEVTVDSPRLFRCRARTEELLVTVQFRADPAYWEEIPDRLGPRLDLEPLEAYPGTETSGNLLMVRLEKPWTVAVLAATQERPDPTDAQLEAVLRGLDALRR